VTGESPQGRFLRENPLIRAISCSNHLKRLPTNRISNTTEFSSIQE